MLGSCSAAPALYVREYKSEDGFDVVASNDGDGVEITTTKDLLSLTVNKMSYDYQNDEYTVEKILYSADRFDKNGSLAIKLDLDSEVPYVMISYSLETGEHFQQYIHRSDGRLWLLMRENP